MRARGQSQLSARRTACEARHHPPRAGSRGTTPAAREGRRRHRPQPHARPDPGRRRQRRHQGRAVPQSRCLLSRPQSEERAPEEPEGQQAIRWLVDYQGMADTFLKGRSSVHQSFWPSGFLGALDDKPYKLDIAKAKAAPGRGRLSGRLHVKLDVAQHQPLDGDRPVDPGRRWRRAGIKVEIIPGEQQAGDHQVSRAQSRHGACSTGARTIMDPHTNADTFARNPDNTDNAKSKPLAWRNAWDIPDITKATDAAVRERDGDKRERDVPGICSGSYRRTRRSSSCSSRPSRWRGARTSSGFVCRADLRHHLLPPGEEDLRARRSTGRAGPPMRGAATLTQAACAPVSRARRRTAWPRRAASLRLPSLLTFFGLLAVTFLIGRVVPIDPVLAVVGDRAAADSLRAGAAGAGPRPPALWSSSASMCATCCTAISARRSLTSPAGARGHRALLPGHPRAGDAGDAARRRSSACRWACSPPSSQGRWPDQLVRVVGLVGYSVPVFWLGLVGLLLFYAKLAGSRGPGGSTSPTTDIVDPVTGLILIDAAARRRMGHLLRTRSATSILPASILGYFSPRLHQPHDAQLHARPAAPGIRHDGAGQGPVRAARHLAPRARATSWCR